MLAIDELVEKLANTPLSTGVASKASSLGVEVLLAA